MCVQRTELHTHGQNRVGDFAEKMKLTVTLSLRSSTGCFAKVTVNSLNHIPKCYNIFISDDK